MSVVLALASTPQYGSEAELAAFAKALAHPTRVQIVRLLLSRDVCFCGEIVDELPLAQATVSQHLKVLKEAGLIRGEIDGPRTYYSLDRERLVALHQQIGALVREVVELRENGCVDND
jgi:ArsR family transcriptional regulator